MKTKTADLIGPALRWAVAKCEGFNVGVITVEEQWARFIEGAAPDELERYAGEYAAIKAGFKTELCKVHDDGYKSALDARAWRFDTDWGIGGPIIAREGISLLYLYVTDDPFRWAATQKPTIKKVKPESVYGPTPLIAAMRCFVSSKLGDEVDVPEELL